jgi:hypothetical protein
MVLLFLVAGCEHHVPRTQPPVLNPPLPEPILPPGYQKVAPMSAMTSREIVAQTAAIIDGDVSDVQFTYDDCAGPRTNYILTGARTLVGAEVPSQVTLSFLGGPLPDGSWIRVSELPRLALDSHYVAFLRKTDWTFSPIVGDVILRRESVGGHEVLVSPEGQLVTGWGENGVSLSSAVFGPVGHSVHGYRTANASVGPSHAPTASPYPEAQSKRAEAGTASPGQGRLPVASIGSPLAQAPSAQEIRAAGLFDRPALLNPDLAANGISAENFVSAVKTAAARDNLVINGRATLFPFWRCWSFTRTASPFHEIPLSVVNTR